MSCITSNSHKCYNDTQIDGLVLQFIDSHFYPHLEERNGSFGLMPLCEEMTPFEGSVIKSIAGSDKCSYEEYSEKYLEFNMCHDRAFRVIFEADEFASFFPNAE